jgi:hypothetical protein
MIKFVEWLLGQRANDIKDEHSAAVEDVQVSRALRASSERIGAEQRRRLARNGFGAAFEAAFYANDRRGRRP